LRVLSRAGGFFTWAGCGLCLRAAGPAAVGRPGQPRRLLLALRRMHLVGVLPALYGDATRRYRATRCPRPRLACSALGFPGRSDCELRYRRGHPLGGPRLAAGLMAVPARRSRAGLAAWPSRGSRVGYAGSSSPVPVGSGARCTAGCMVASRNCAPDASAAQRARSSACTPSRLQYAVAVMSARDQHRDAGRQDAGQRGAYLPGAVQDGGGQPDHPGAARLPGWRALVHEAQHSGRAVSGLPQAGTRSGTGGGHCPAVPGQRRPVHFTVVPREAWSGTLQRFPTPEVRRRDRY
jgi:hypothetical protein